MGQTSLFHLPLLLLILFMCVPLLRAQTGDGHDAFSGRCDDDKCLCKPGYTPNDDNNKCLGGVEQRCVYDEHCIPGAYCHSQTVCKCKQATPQIAKDGLKCTNGGQSRAHFNHFLVVVAASILILLCVKS